MISSKHKGDKRGFSPPSSSPSIPSFPAIITSKVHQAYFASTSTLSLTPLLPSPGVQKMACRRRYPTKTVQSSNHTRTPILLVIIACSCPRPPPRLYIRIFLPPLRLILHSYNRRRHNFPFPAIGSLFNYKVSLQVRYT